MHRRGVTAVACLGLVLVWTVGDPVPFVSASSSLDGGSATQANNSCGWVSGFWSRDFDRQVSALVVFDDGTGPDLYAVGYFRRANGRFVNGFARWDGASWAPLDDAGGIWGNGGAFALAVFDDGSGAALYAGGVAVDSQGLGRPVVARWDGAAWSEIGQLSNPSPHTHVEALVAYDDGSGAALYASGGFDVADGVEVNHIAKWTGTAWKPLTGPLGTGTENPARALRVYDDGGGVALYVGGYIPHAGGVEVNGVAKWDGSTWSALAGPSGFGTDGSVSTLEVWDDGSGPALFVAGTFSESGGVFSLSIARWDGSAWSALSGPSLPGISGGYAWVHSLTVHDDGTGSKLYVGGEFTQAGGLEALNIARWDGSSWSVLDGPAGNGASEIVSALASFDDGGGTGLFAGGDFDLAGGVPVGKIARWNGGAWSPLSAATGHGLGSSAVALEVFDDGGGPEVIAGGYFGSAGDIPASSVAAWDGDHWSALDGPSGDGIRGEVRALEVWDRGSGPELYAGGGFSVAGGLPIKTVACWNGIEWAALAGSSGTWMGGIRDLAVFDDGTGSALFAGGSFTQVSGVAADRIAKWNGSVWSPLAGPSGNGVDARVDALMVFDDGTGPALHVGGWFDTAGGVTVNRIAKWNGSAWSALTGPSGTGVGEFAVLALEVFDDGGGPDLYAGGYFDTAGGVTVNGIARWDGSEWSSVGGPLGVGAEGGVVSMTVWDDGTGLALYIGGRFPSAGGVDAYNIARWDGSTWSVLDGPAGNGFEWSVSDLYGYDDDRGPALFAAGYLDSAGGLASDRFAVWRCPDGLLFWDGFELGDTSSWNVTQP